MANITIYTAMLCPFCTRAKQLLKQKGQAFTEIDVTFDRAKRAAMRDAAGGRNSVPQIWIGDTHVGGCDDLFELEANGRLDDLLSGGASPA